MGPTQHSVEYCCVWRGGRAVYAYRGNTTPESIEDLAKSCLQLAPPFHRWYVERIGKRAFGFLMEDGHVYFVIADHAFGNKGILGFLHHLRDEFRKRKSTDQLVPVLHRLISSLGNVAVELSPPLNGAAEVAKAPLLGKSERKKMKEHVIGIELEEARKSTTMTRQSSSSSSTAASPLHKELGSGQLRSSSSRHIHVRRRWCRQVKIVIAIDVAVCLVLFGVWLGICGGLSCIS